jgi:hypothetical protein
MGECLGGYGVMGVYGGPNVVEDGLRVSYDAGNVKCYPGSGNTLFSLNGTENATASTISTATDTTSGTILNHNTSTSVSVTLSPVVNHEVWSIMFWIRSTGLTTSNFRNVVAIKDTNSSHSYFYNFDTRETTNSFILGYQKHFSINSWLTTSFNNSTQWAEQKWWLCYNTLNNATNTQNASTGQSNSNFTICDCYYRSCCDSSNISSCDFYLGIDGYIFHCDYWVPVVLSVLYFWW